jgi:AraC-like DNA-binding protein
MQTKKDYTLDIQQIFCKEFQTPMLTSANWVTQSFPVLTMFTDKKGKFIINDKSETEFEVQRHQPYFLAANLQRKPHIENNEEMRLLAFGFRCRIGNGTDLFGLLDIPLFFNKKDSEHLRDLMLELYAIESANSDNWLKTSISKKRLCYEIIETILSSISIDKKILLSFIENFHCTPAIEYLNQNYMQPLDIPKLMRLCNLSRTHFFRLFKKQTNSTPFEYLKNCRIQESQRMLLCTDLSVSEIGYQVGWSDQFHFSRIFKKETGLSPKHYRQQSIGM